MCIAKYSPLVAQHSPMWSLPRDSWSEERAIPQCVPHWGGQSSWAARRWTERFRRGVVSRSRRSCASWRTSRRWRRACAGRPRRRCGCSRGRGSAAWPAPGRTPAPEGMSRRSVVAGAAGHPPRPASVLPPRDPWCCLLLCQKDGEKYIENRVYTGFQLATSTLAMFVRWGEG